MAAASTSWVGNAADGLVIQVPLLPVYRVSLDQRNEEVKREIDITVLIKPGGYYTCHGSPTEFRLTFNGERSFIISPCLPAMQFHFLPAHAGEKLGKCLFKCERLDRTMLDLRDKEKYSYYDNNNCHQYCAVYTVKQ